MAKAILTGASPTKQPNLRIVRFRCIDCGQPLHWHKGEPFCTDCTRYTVTPAVEVTTGPDVPEELLQRLHDGGWDVVAGRDGAKLYRPDVRTGAEARAALAAFDLTMFGIEE